MKHSYLNNQSWEDITRDERTFCAELFFEVRKIGAGKFVSFLNQKTKMNLENSSNWEIGFEVCLYRDVLKSIGQPVKTSKYPQKRTFDLCLFGQNEIVIIEAKAQQGFTTGQNSKFEQDKQLISELLGISQDDVHIVALASSQYFQNVVKYADGLPPLFKGNMISWLEVGDWTNNEFVKRADSLYKK